MAEVPNVTSSREPQGSSSFFAPVYYDSPIDQVVLGITMTSKDSLTAAIMAGSPYFKVTLIDVCDWVLGPRPILEPNPIPPPVGHNPPKVVFQHELAAQTKFSAVPQLESIPTLNLLARHLSAPIATPNGVTPLAVETGHYARLWVTTNVLKGSSLPITAFVGTAILKGQNITTTVILQGTYLAILMGNLIVQPTTVVPRESVFVQVCDAAGKPISDPSVAVAIRWVAVKSRYYQFATPATRTLMVTASRVALRETALV